MSGGNGKTRVKPKPKKPSVFITKTATKKKPPAKTAAKKKAATKRRNA